MASRMDRRFVIELNQGQYDLVVEWLRNRNAAADTVAEEWTLQQAFEEMVRHGAQDLALELAEDTKGHS